MSLLTVAVSHRTAPLALLERLSLSSADRVRVLHELVGGAHVREAVVLATCNRLEVIAEVQGVEDAVAEVCGVLSRRAGISEPELSPYVVAHEGDQALEHLLAVAAGLESMVVGEAQVLGQVRSAYASAQSAGTVGRHLHAVLQRALRVGKRVRAETGLDEAGASVVSVALAQVADRTGELAGRQVLVIGAGSTGALTTAALARRGADITVINRTPGSAERLAASVHGRAADMDTLPDHLISADIVVACTGASGTVVGVDAVATAMASRAGRGSNGHPLVVVDLAVPRDVDPAVASLPGVLLLDLSMLHAGRAHHPGGLVTDPDAAEDVAAARALVALEASLWCAERRTAAVVPTVSALRRRATHVVDQELLRLCVRLPDLDDEAHGEVTRTIHRVVAKLLHEPTVRIKESAGASMRTDYTTALRDLFDLDRWIPEAPGAGVGR